MQTKRRCYFFNYLEFTFFKNKQEIKKLGDHLVGIIAFTNNAMFHFLFLS